MLFGSLAKPNHVMSKFCWGELLWKWALLLCYLDRMAIDAVTVFLFIYLFVCLVFFLSGNAQTLKHEPKKSGINTYKRLREFWKRYYSAHYMTLTVQSRGNKSKISRRNLLNFEHLNGDVWLKGVSLLYSNPNSANCSSNCSSQSSGSPFCTHTFVWWSQTVLPL